MKYVSQHISISLYLIVLLLCSGCVSLSTYQSPKIIEKGDAQVGVGMLAGFGGKVYGMPHIVRFYSLYGDIRYQIVTDPLYVAGSLGISTFNIEDYRTTGLYPTIMFGTERIFGGVKWIHMIASSDEAEESLGTNFPGVVAGASFGRSFSIMPEINIYFAEDELLIFPGIGLQ